jgi:hypothetical protein
MQCSFFDESSDLLGMREVTEWLAPAISTVWLSARLAYHRLRSGLMVLSRPATNIQRGLVLQAAVVIVAGKIVPQS